MKWTPADKYRHYHEKIKQYEEQSEDNFFDLYGFMDKLHSKTEDKKNEKINGKA